MNPAPEASRFRALTRAPRDRPLVIAHRGDSVHAPENTLEAGRLGWQSGADAWEFDVQLTRDGVPIVFHDESLLRTTDVARRFADDPRAATGFRVARFDHDEVRMLDAGSWFLDLDGGPRSAAGFGTVDELSPQIRAWIGAGAVRIPTLAEALSLTVRFDWLANVELKSFPNDDDRIVAAVLDAIDDAGAADRVVISSFNHDDVARTARQRPEIATGVLASTPLYRPEEYVRSQVSADFYHPSVAVLGAEAERYHAGPSARHLHVDAIRRLNERGVPVLVYTVNDGRLARHLAEVGAAGLFTDDPRRIRALLDAEAQR